MSQWHQVGVQKKRKEERKYKEEGRGRGESRRGGKREEMRNEAQRPTRAPCLNVWASWQRLKGGSCLQASDENMVASQIIC